MCVLKLRSGKNFDFMALLSAAPAAHLNSVRLLAY